MSTGGNTREAEADGSAYLCKVLRHSYLAEKPVACNCVAIMGYFGVWWPFVSGYLAHVFVGYLAFQVGSLHSVSWRNKP